MSSFFPQAIRTHLEAGSAPVIIATVFTTIAAISVTRLVFQEKKVKIIKGPTATLLPKLSRAEKDALPYPPDALPGGRDVDSPYGTMRVFEWGPENGRKVLLVHGLTTSCLAVGPVAHGLVEKGCRVMLFDLWGRGYSDACADIDHDDRLYATQILIAVTSSPLSWTGESKFSLIGYSLGGGISASFASYFPNLVESLVLIAPTGLIRPHRVAAQNRILWFIRLLPKGLMERYLKKRLRTPLFPRENKDQIKIETGPEAMANAEIESAKSPMSALAPPSLKYPDITVISALQWQLQVHAGFITALVSSLLYSPGSHQHELWKRFRLREDKILVFAATHDPIINPVDLEEDATALLGADHLEWRLIDGAHDFPGTDPDKVVGFICEFWGL